MSAASQVSPSSPHAEQILRAIRRIVQRVTNHSKLLLRDTGFTVPQLLCLRVIADAEQGEEVTPAVVARRVELSPATVTGILDRLERGNFVRRERRSKDRRKICLALTSLGRERLDALPPLLQERFVERFAQLDVEEREALVAAL